MDLCDWERSNRDVPIKDDPLRNADGIIVGGGGLLENEFFAPAMNRLRLLNQVGVKVALWGLGHNEWKLQDWRKLKHKIILPDFDNALIGIRDYGHNHRWVPCVSAMSRFFDKKYEAKHEVVTFLHSATLQKWPRSVEMLKNLPRMSNSTEMKIAVEFLASGEVVLTDSYHGAYWGTLLGKRVVAFPSSSKFYDLRHAVPLCVPSDWKRFRELARAYPNSLEECRIASQKFAEDVKDFFADN